MTLTPLGEAVLLVMVCAIAIFAPWWIGFPLVLVYNFYVGWRMVRHAERLRQIKDEIRRREAEMRRLLDERFR